MPGPAPRPLLASVAELEPTLLEPSRRRAGDPPVRRPAPEAPSRRRTRDPHPRHAPEPPRRDAPDPGAKRPPERRRAGRRRRYNRHLRDALTQGQRLTLAAFIVAWTALITTAWSWWLQPSNSGSLLGLWINSALLSVESLVLPTWFFFWLWRMRRPDPNLAVPVLRTAMVVTKAPSEPWPVVQETLEAMLRQDFPYDYDVWLADEDPSPETLRWCEDRGVRVSSRKGVTEYHRPTWPRRTKCKEGNLAYFYDMWGYDLYDVVAQLDADHVPDRDYLRHMVLPFNDPHVGYVAAPSICDRNARRSWSARARLYAEAVLHGPMQAGHSGGCAPSCIGSHYAVRTAALKEIGGLGPELAEDFTTSLMMSSHRWQGVFAIAAHAHGDGPATVADCMTQEFQWSRSMMNVLLQINRRYWHGLSLAAKLRLGFCQIWYPLFAFLMLASIALPLVAILTRTPLMRVSLGGFYLRFGPPTLLLLAVVIWLRNMEVLRPRDAKTVSWEIVLFQLVRWPWVLFGCAQAIAGRIAGREFSFKVTPKGATGPQPLPTRIVLPYLGIALVSALPAILGLDAGRAHGYFTLALINVALYFGAALAVVVLHVYDHPVAMRRAALRLSQVKLAATAGLVVLTAFAIALPIGVGGGAAATAPAPWPLAAETVPGVQVGVSTDALARNPTTPWQAADLDQVNAFEQAVHAHAGIVMWYADWAHRGVDAAQLVAVSRRGSVPEIVWEPWDYSRGVLQPRYTLASIIAGSHDAYIRSFARALRAYGKPVLLRFAQEMNGSWYPWDEGINGNRRGQFVQAWRHVHDVFAAEGASNVKWIWSPAVSVGRPLGTRQYPGSAYVDVVGLSGFNGGRAVPGTSGWEPFARLFDRSLASLQSLAPSKPVQISEVASASAGGDEATWIAGMLRDVSEHPQVRSVIWFDVTKESDWRLSPGSHAASAFAQGIRDYLRPALLSPAPPARAATTGFTLLANAPGQPVRRFSRAPSGR